MEINVTKFVQAECMRDYSASVAEIGPDAGPSTWRASTEASEDWNFLPDADALQEFREWLKPWGAWDDVEITAMSDDHLRALCLQWIASDWRECFEWPEHAAGIDWDYYQSMAQDGQCPSSFYHADDGSIYWSMDH